MKSVPHSAHRKALGDQFRIYCDGFLHKVLTCRETEAVNRLVALSNAYPQSFWTCEPVGSSVSVI